MFGFGFSELMIILVALIIFVGPNDMPKLIRFVGKIYRKWQQTYYAIMNEFQSMVDWDDSQHNRK